MATQQSFDNRNTGALFNITGGWQRGPFQVGETTGCTILRDADGKCSVSSDDVLVAVAKIPALPVTENVPTKGKMIVLTSGEEVRLVVFVAQHQEHGTYYQIKVDKFQELRHPDAAAKAFAKLK